MKLRTGFISNSSSSSFVIAAPHFLSVDEMVAILGVDVASPIYPFIKRIAALLVKRNGRDFAEDEEGILSLAECETVEELTARAGQSKENRYRVYLEALRRHWVVLEGSASDEEDDSAERALCAIALNVITTQVILWKREMY
jgi:hypothetical protein